MEAEDTIPEQEPNCNGGLFFDIASSAIRSYCRDAESPYVSADERFDTMCRREADRLVDFFDAFRTATS